MNDALTRLETLYRDVGPGLLAYLRRRFGDRQAAEDLLQETFVQAVRRVEWLTEAVSPRAWLFGIARHVALTAQRRHRRLQPLPADLETVGPSADPRLESVRRAIAELPDVFRETLELRLRDGLTYEEIADVLQIPVGTVRSRLHHALQRLRVAVLEAET